ncbi:AfsR/SARP family transcriptional regulator [Actinoplanes sp. RD1]|uniref:AfsR/SARP family transcriptional regulator n=1 Tax=Actinoplanes sp. RD1 TaxID=3064538 RepID=UPI0027424939|nr:AfsR/SARP family transcriptional regulator [Actinoplanes sp. RD1]
MRFQMLGSLQISRGDGWEPPGPRKQSVTLAMLLCHRNEAVSADQLVDAVWEDHPPRTARENLQVHIYHLRRALGDRDRILRRDDGYLLRVAAGEADEDEFDRLCAAARRSAAAGDTAAAAAGYHEALALWRGPALGDLADVPALRVEAARLEERRLTAWEESAELDLALGRHADLVAGQARLVAEHPLRERLRAQLMTALYRSGRQAEALSAYHDGRRILADELGLDPGPGLRALHQAILDGSLGGGDRPAAAPASAPARAEPVPVAEVTTPAPAQLPADIADFAGRDDLLARIRAWLRPGAGPSAAIPVVSVSGMAGAGKTALAVHAAHLVRDAFPDGQLYVGLRTPDGGEVSPAAALGRFLRALGVPAGRIPDSAHERTELYRSRLAGSRVLVVLDDAAGEAQVRPLLPGSASCAVLVTSRARLVGLEGVLGLHLDALPTEDGLAVLRRVLGVERVHAEPEAAEDIVRLCAGLPLALRMAVARLAARPQWTLGRFRDQLADDTRRLDLLAAGDLAVRTGLARSYHDLPVPDRRVLRLLALLPAGEFRAELAAATVGLPAGEAQLRLEALVDAQLLTALVVDDTGVLRYRLHDFVRLFARERCRAEDSAADRYRAVARAAAATLTRSYGPAAGDPRRAAARRWLHRVAERADGVTGAGDSWHDAADLLDLAIRLAAADTGTGGWRWSPPDPAAALPAGYLEDLRVVHRRALAAAETAGDGSGEAAVLYALAALEIAGGRPGAAGPPIARAVRTFEALGADRAATAGRYALAFLDEAAGRPERARERYVLASALSRRSGDTRAEATALAGLARAAARLRDHAAARLSLERSAALWAELGEPGELARVRLALGGLHLDARRTAEAEAAFGQALELPAPGEAVEAYARYGLGEAQARQGRPGPAVAAWHEALRLARRLGHLPLQARTLLALARLYLDSGLGSRAIGPAGQALTAYEELDDETGRQQALTALADAHTAGQPVAPVPPAFLTGGTDVSPGRPTSAGRGGRTGPRSR